MLFNSIISIKAPAYFVFSGLKEAEYQNIPRLKFNLDQLPQDILMNRTGLSDLYLNRQIKKYEAFLNQVEVDLPEGLLVDEFLFASVVSRIPFSKIGEGGFRLKFESQRDAYICTNRLMRVPVFTNDFPFLPFLLKMNEATAGFNSSVETLVNHDVFSFYAGKLDPQLIKDILDSNGSESNILQLLEENYLAGGGLLVKSDIMAQRYAQTRGWSVIYRQHKLERISAVVDAENVWELGRPLIISLANWLNKKINRIFPLITAGFQNDIKFLFSYEYSFKETLVDIAIYFRWWGRKILKPSSKKATVSSQAADRSEMIRCLEEGRYAKDIPAFLDGIKAGMIMIGEHHDVRPDRVVASEIIDRCATISDLCLEMPDKWQRKMQDPEDSVRRSAFEYYNQVRNYLVPDELVRLVNAARMKDISVWAIDRNKRGFQISRNITWRSLCYGKRDKFNMLPKVKSVAKAARGKIVVYLGAEHIKTRKTSNNNSLAKLLERGKIEFYSVLQEEDPVINYHANQLGIKAENILVPVDRKIYGVDAIIYNLQASRTSWENRDLKKD